MSIMDRDPTPTHGSLWHQWQHLHIIPPTSQNQGVHTPSRMPMNWLCAPYGFCLDLCIKGPPFSCVLENNFNGAATQEAFLCCWGGQQATRKALSEEIKSDNDGLCNKICGACVSWITDYNDTHPMWASSMMGVGQGLIIAFGFSKILLGCVVYQSQVWELSSNCKRTTLTLVVPVRCTCAYVWNTICTAGWQCGSFEVTLVAVTGWRSQLLWQGRSKGEV